MEHKCVITWRLFTMYQTDDKDHENRYDLTVTIKKDYLHYDLHDTVKDKTLWVANYIDPIYKWMIPIAGEDISKVIRDCVEYAVQVSKDIIEKEKQ